MSKEKQKGNRLENLVAKFYQRKLDPRATRMPTSGAVDGFKGDILKRVWDGWTDEVKSRKTMAIYDFWQQTTDQAGDNSKPVLFIKADHKPVLAIIRIEDYFDMREELQDWRDTENQPKIQNFPNRNIQYHLSAIKNACNSILQELRKSCKND